MKTWFYGLQPRERWIFLAGAVTALIILLWGAVLRPLSTETAALRAATESTQRLLLEVTRLESSRPALVAGNQQGSDQTLVVIVSNTAAQHGLDLPRTRPNGPSGIDVTFQGASFDSLVAWLVSLHTSYGVDVESASFSSARQPGLVNGQLSLHRL
jgi:type II secretory pathway component PulM